MARAKRTDRADARRRYRLTQDAVDDSGDHTSAPVPNVLSGGGGRPSSSSGSSGRAKSVTAPRPIGFVDSMRASWHRPDVRADIAALPWLLRTRAFLIPLALVVVGAGALTLAPDNPAAGLFFQLMVLPPAMAPIFITGFFAKRASYLLGLIIAVIDVVGYAVFVYAALPALSVDPVTAARQQELVSSALVVGPLSGIFFAAGAAWYRRFLSFSSSQRARSRGAERPKARRASRG